MWLCSRTVTVYTITDSIRKRVVEVFWALQEKWRVLALGSQKAGNDL